MDSELRRAEQERANVLAKQEGEKALRLIEDLTPYIRDMEDDFLGDILEVDCDKPESVAAHLEQVRSMQNLNKLQDKIAEKITAGQSAAKQIEKNSR